LASSCRLVISASPGNAARGPIQLQDATSVINVFNLAGSPPPYDQDGPLAPEVVTSQRVRAARYVLTALRSLPAAGLDPPPPLLH